MAAGEAPVSSELWYGRVSRSFDEVDGQRRLRDLYNQMKPIDTDQGLRFKIYPGRDELVMRIVRKVVRGLAHFHQVDTGVKDEQVWADILTFQLPKELINTVVLMHREPDVLEYWYESYSEGAMRSVWYLKFFQNVPFLAAIHTMPIDSTG
jgi:hypothetical protein